MLSHDSTGTFSKKLWFYIDESIILDIKGIFRSGALRMIHQSICLYQWALLCVIFTILDPGNRKLTRRRFSISEIPFVNTSQE